MRTKYKSLWMNLLLCVVAVFDFLLHSSVWAEKGKKCSSTNIHSEAGNSHSCWLLGRTHLSKNNLPRNNRVCSRYFPSASFLTNEESPWKEEKRKSSRIFWIDRCNNSTQKNFPPPRYDIEITFFGMMMLLFAGAQKCSLPFGTLFDSRFDSIVAAMFATTSSKSPLQAVKWIPRKETDLKIIKRQRWKKATSSLLVE